MIFKNYYMKVIKDLHNKYHKDLRGEFSCFLSIYSGFQYVRLYKTCMKYIPAPAKVLDWGAGNGHFSYFLTMNGYDVDAIEFKPIINSDLQGLPNYRHTKGSLDDPVALPYQKETFDAVFSVGVLEHVRLTGGDELKSLKEIHRILKQNGYFICYHLPNKYSWIEILAKLLPMKYRHQYKYSFRNVDKLMKKAALEIVYYKKYGFFPRKMVNYLFTDKMKSSVILARILNALDEVLSFLFPIVCQNQIIVAKKYLIKYY